MKRNETETRHDDRDLTGLCDEAQADGVPCYEAGRQCETCGRARQEAEAPKAPRPPGKPLTKKH